MVLYTQIKGNDLIKQNDSYFQNHPQDNKKVKKEKGNRRMMSRFIGRRFKYYEYQNRK